MSEDAIATSRVQLAASCLPRPPIHALDSICYIAYNLQMVEVVGGEEFEEWFDGLNEDDTAAVVKVVDLLEAKGVALPFPYSSEIKGTEYALRELRIQSKGHRLRVMYAFDPKRQAVLLIGGDKTGDDQFYETMIPKAEGVWKRYLTEVTP